MTGIIASENSDLPLQKKKYNLFKQKTFELEKYFTVLNNFNKIIVKIFYQINAALVNI